MCKDGDPKQCLGDRTVQCLVGGYEQVRGCTVGCDHADQQLGDAPAPYPVPEASHRAGPALARW